MIPRTLIQARFSASDPRFTSPDRDLAYCGPHLIEMALLGLEGDHLEPWVRTFLNEHAISDDDLVKVAESLADYITNTLLDPQYKEPLHALQASGFFELPEAARTAVLARIGQVMLCTVFPCVRDVTRNPAHPHFDVKAMRDIVGTARANVEWYMNLPFWRRWIYNGYRWFKRKFARKRQI